MPTIIRTTVLLVAALALAACGDPAPPPAAEGPAAGAAPTAVEQTPVAPAPTETTEQLLARANAALAEDKLFEPAGDNALELYLAAIEQAEAAAATTDGADAKGKPARLSDAMATADLVTQTKMAVTDILPYGLVWVERAITNDNRPEAARVLALLERAQPGATSLQRLRDQLAEAEVAAERELERAAAAEAAAAEQAAQAAAEPAPVAPTPAPAVTQPAPAASTPAATTPAPVATTTPATTAPAPASTAPRPTAPAAVPAGARPKLISQPSMRYPTQALRRGTEGVVVVAFTIQPDGTTANARVTSATPRGIFDREALRMIEGLKFQPPGRAVQTQQQIDFKLDQ